jgi:hypothetical protein
MTEAFQKHVDTGTSTAQQRDEVDVQISHLAGCPLPLGHREQDLRADFVKQFAVVASRLKPT